MTPLAAAVEPLRAATLDRAEQDARAAVALIAEGLEAAGWDCQKFAPHPSSGLPRAQYAQRDARRALVARLTRSLDPDRPSSYAPDPCEMDPTGVEAFVAECRAHADEQYTAFIAKLEEKVGPHDSATLIGSHVWGTSILTVRKGDAVERWRTRQVVNVSKLGVPFYQWPSRLLKS